MSVPDRAGEVTQAPDPVRAVFRTALRDMLLLLGPLAVLGVGAGALVAGRPGVWGALLGVAMTLLFSGSTIVSMLVTARSSAATTGAVIMGTWLVKMIVLIAALVALRGLDFYDRSVLGIVLLVGVLGAVLLDYLAVRRGRVPYTEPGAGQVS
jgi:hypothetical protein